VQSGQDLLQGALERTLARWRKVQQMAGPEAYVRRALVNARISQRRRWGILRETTSAELPDVGIGDDTADVDHRLLLLRALHSLPARQRAVMVLRYFEDLSEGETAALLGCSVGTVKSQAARALQRLRDDPNVASWKGTGVR
jgi:RNA polymerase sigma-70 factor (sigma-E family)